MTVIVIRHSLPDRACPSLPVQLGRHAVVCRDCSCVEEVRRCLCQVQTQPEDWVVLELGEVDERQWTQQADAFAAALDRLSASYIEVQGASCVDLQDRLRLQHAPAAVVVDRRDTQGGYPLSLGIIAHRIAREA